MTRDEGGRGEAPGGCNRSRIGQPHGEVTHQTSRLLGKCCAIVERPTESDSPEDAAKSHCRLLPGPHLDDEVADLCNRVINAEPRRGRRRLLNQVGRLRAVRAVGVTPDAISVMPLLLLLLPQLLLHLLLLHLLLLPRGGSLLLTLVLRLLQLVPLLAELMSPRPMLRAMLHAMQPCRCRVSNGGSQGSGDSARGRPANGVRCRGSAPGAEGRQLAQQLGLARNLLTKASADTPGRYGLCWNRRQGSLPPQAYRPEASPLLLPSLDSWEDLHQSRNTLR